MVINDKKTEASVPDEKEVSSRGKSWALPTESQADSWPTPDPVTPRTPVQSFTEMLTSLCLFMFAPLLTPLQAYAKTGKPIAAYCSATLMLAASGLLDGRRATTVWWLSQMFERNFEQVNLCMDAFVENIHCCTQTC